MSRFQEGYDIAVEQEKRQRMTRPSEDRPDMGKHDVRGHFPYHDYPHPDTHSHDEARPSEDRLRDEWIDHLNEDARQRQGLPPRERAERDAALAASRPAPEPSPEAMAVIYGLARESLAQRDEAIKSGWLVNEMPHDEEVRSWLASTPTATAGASAAGSASSPGATTMSDRSGPCVECGWHPDADPEDSALRQSRRREHERHAASRPAPDTVDDKAEREFLKKITP